MNKLLLILVLMLPTAASSLELKLGIMKAEAPLYEGVYSDPEMWSDPIDDTGLIGRVEIGHNFKLAENVGVNVFAMHMSLVTERDPHFGINAVGAELVFKLY